MDQYVVMLSVLFVWEKKKKTSQMCAILWLAAGTHWERSVLVLSQRIWDQYAWSDICATLAFLQHRVNLAALCALQLKNGPLTACL